MIYAQSAAIYLFIYLLIDFLKAYSPVDRTGSPQGFSPVSREGSYQGEKQKCIPTTSTTNYDSLLNTHSTGVEDLKGKKMEKIN